MKMKTSGILSRTVMMILAAVLFIGTAVNVLAAGDPIEGTETNPAQAGITKKLTMPEGTTTPPAAFTFSFTAQSVDDSTLAADLSTMPSIGPVTISFSGSDTGTSAAGAKTVIKQSDDVLAGITFPHAGVYVYEISEDQDPGYSTDTTESFTFSPGKYQLTVYVKNGQNGLYVAAIASTITVNDGDGGTTNLGDKVDPTPKPGDPNITGEYSQMIFTNSYVKKGGGTPEDPDNHLLAISKEVTGDYGDRTKYFTFDTTINLPAGVTGSATYEGYVVDASNQIVTSADNASSITAGTYGDCIVFTPGTNQIVHLKHGQKLVFTELHVGATYVSEESAVEHYTASVDIVVNGGTPINITNPAHNTSLSTDTRLIGENKNSAAFKNDYRTITPTGIVINNLPFIMVLALAAGALVSFVAVKYHKKSRYR